MSGPVSARVARNALHQWPRIRSRHRPQHALTAHTLPKAKQPGREVSRTRSWEAPLWGCTTSRAAGVSLHLGRELLYRRDARADRRLHSLGAPWSHVSVRDGYGVRHVQLYPYDTAVYGFTHTRRSQRAERPLGRRYCTGKLLSIPYIHYITCKPWVGSIDFVF